MRGENLAEDNNETLENQKQYQKKFDPVGFIIAIVLVGMIVIVAMSFLQPTIGNVYEGNCGCYSMSADEYKAIEKAINDLIDGGTPNTSSLIHILITEGPERYNGAKYQSFAAEEETCGWCNDKTKTVYLLLKAAYEYAQGGIYSTARNYLNQSKDVWESP